MKHFMTNFTRRFALVMGASAMLLSSCGVDDLESDISSLNDKVDALVDQHLADIAEQSKNLDEAVANFEALKGNHEDLEKVVAGLEAQLAADKSELEGSISDLESDLTALEGTVAGLDKELDLKASQSDLDALKTAVGNLDGTYATDADLKAAVDKLEGSISDINDDIDALNKKDTELETSISGLQTAVLDNMASISDLSGRVAALETRMDDAALSIKALQDRDDELANLITAAQDAADAAQDAADNNAVNIDLNKDAIAANLVLINKLTQTVADLDQTVADYKTYVEKTYVGFDDFAAEFTEQLDANKDKINGWIGDYMDSTWNTYFTASLAKDSKEYDAFKTAVDALIMNAVDTDMIPSNADVKLVQDNLDKLDDRVDDLEDEMDDAQEDIDALEEDVLELMNQIQSISFVPSQLNDNGVDGEVKRFTLSYCTGYNTSNSKPIYTSHAILSKISHELVYDVRPAEAAAAIVKAFAYAQENDTDDDYYVQVENMTKAMDKAEVAAIELVAGKEGRIAVTIEADYEDNSASDDAVAFGIAIDRPVDLGNDEKYDVYTDIMSDYATLRKPDYTITADVVNIKLVETQDIGKSLFLQDESVKFEYDSEDQEPLFESLSTKFVVVDDANKTYYSYDAKSLKETLGVDLTDVANSIKFEAVGIPVLADYAGKTVTDANIQFAAQKKNGAVVPNKYETSLIEPGTGGFAGYTATQHYATTFMLGSRKCTLAGADAIVEIETETLNWTATAEHTWKSTNVYYDPDTKQYKLTLELNDVKSTETELDPSISLEDIVADLAAAGKYSELEIVAATGSKLVFEGNAKAFQPTWSEDDGYNFTLYLDKVNFAEIFGANDLDENGTPAKGNHDETITISWDKTYTDAYGNISPIRTYKIEIDANFLAYPDYVEAKGAATNGIYQYSTTKTVATSDPTAEEIYSKYVYSFDGVTIPDESKYLYFSSGDFKKYVADAVADDSASTERGVVKTITTTFDGGNEENRDVDADQLDIKYVDPNGELTGFAPYYRISLAKDYYKFSDQEFTYVNATTLGNVNMPYPTTFKYTYEFGFDFDAIASAVVRNEGYFGPAGSANENKIYLTGWYYQNGAAMTDDEVGSANGTKAHGFGFKNIPMNEVFYVVDEDDNLVLPSADLDIDWHFIYEAASSTVRPETLKGGADYSWMNTDNEFTFVSTAESTEMLAQGVKVDGVILVDAFENLLGDERKFDIVVDDAQRPISYANENASFEMGDGYEFEYSAIAPNESESIKVVDQISLGDRLGHDIFANNGAGEWSNIWYGTSSQVVYSSVISDGSTVAPSITYGAMELVDGYSASQIATFNDLVKMDADTGKITLTSNGKGLAVDLVAKVPVTVSTPFYHAVKDFYFTVKKYPQAGNNN